MTVRTLRLQQRPRLAQLLLLARLLLLRRARLPGARVEVLVPAEGVGGGRRATRRLRLLASNMDATQGGRRASELRFGCLHALVRAWRVSSAQYSRTCTLRVSAHCVSRRPSSTEQRGSLAPCAAVLLAARSACARVRGASVPVGVGAVSSLHRSQLPHAQRKRAAATRLVQHGPLLGIPARHGECQLVVTAARCSACDEVIWIVELHHSACVAPRTFQHR